MSASWNASEKWVSEGEKIRIARCSAFFLLLPLDTARPQHSLEHLRCVSWISILIILRILIKKDDYFFIIAVGLFKVSKKQKTKNRNKKQID